MRSPWMSSSYRKHENLKKIEKNIDDKKYIILLNANLGSWVVLTEEEYIRYENNEFNEMEMENLYIRGLALDDKGEEVIIDFPKPAEYPSVVVVNITTDCNLRCKYCFADCGSFEGEYMSKEVMEKLIFEMFTMPSELITFELQGGEPLCYIEGIKDFIEISERLKVKFNKTVQYRTVTNCTKFTEEFIKLAKKYNIQIGASIDGPKCMTDKVRIDTEGNGVFDKIMEGIKYIRDNGLDIDGAVCTIGQHNCNDSDKIVDFFHENKISFKPRPANILGREIESKTTTKKGEWFKSYKDMYYRSKLLGAENFSIHIFEENVYSPIRDYVCLRYPCGAAREIISINPKGQVYPCDGFKGQKEFEIGNIMNESLYDILNKDFVKKLKSRTSEDIDSCRNCLFRSMCCSCCYSAYGAFGTIYREDPHCYDRKKIFNFLLEEWIKNNIK